MKNIFFVETLAKIISMPFLQSIEHLAKIPFSIDFLHVATSNAII